MIKINIDDPDNFQFASSVQKDSKSTHILTQRVSHQIADC